MKELKMKTQTTKTYATKIAAEKSATSKTKKTGIEHFVFEVDGSYLVMTEEQFDAYESPEQAEVEQVEQVEQAEVTELTEPSMWVSGGFEAIDTDPVEQTEQSEVDAGLAKLLEEVVGAVEQAEPVEQPEEQAESVEQTEQTEEQTEPVEKTEEPVVEKDEEKPFAKKAGYTKELTIPYFGLQGTKYLKTEDPTGARIRLASSRVHIVAINGDKVTILTTPRYAEHRRFA